MNAIRAFWGSCGNRGWQRWRMLGQYLWYTELGWARRWWCRWRHRAQWNTGWRWEMRAQLIEQPKPGQHYCPRCDAYDD